MDDVKRKDFLAVAIASNTDECILWPYAVRSSSGYGAFSIGRKNYDAHRFVCVQAHGESDLQAAHSCGNKLCVNPRHLRWCDAKTNMADAKAHGTLRGGGRWRQRLSAADVDAIRASNDSYSLLAERYATDVPYIGKLKRLEARVSHAG